MADEAENDRDPVENETSEESEPAGHAYAVLYPNRNEHDFSLQRPQRKGVGELWKTVTDGTLPSEPTVPYLADNRRFDGKFHYVARYKASDELPEIGSFLGPLVKDQDGGSEYGLLPVPGGRSISAPLTNYEVLVVPKDAVCWNPLSQEGNLPQRSVPGILREGDNIYIGKTDDVGVGMVCKGQSDSWQFYSFKSSEPVADDFKVLCFSPN